MVIRARETEHSLSDTIVTILAIFPMGIEGQNGTEMFSLVWGSSIY